MTPKLPRLLIIDGQGGKMGGQLTVLLKKALPELKITAVGTNSIAAQTMKKAGADAVATGENAVKAACRRADIIVGPIGIVIADALTGEMSPEMAAAVGQSDAVRILIPVNRCENLVAGVADCSTTALLQSAVNMVLQTIRNQQDETC